MSIPVAELRPRLFPFENHQLLAQSGILQGDAFVAGEDENDESQRAANRSDHDEVLWRQRSEINRIALIRFLAKDSYL